MNALRWARDIVLVLLLVAVVGAGIISWKASDLLLDPEEPPVPAKPEDWVVQDVEFRASDGVRLSGWYLPPPMCSTETVCEPGPGLVLSPVRGDNWRAFGRELALLHSTGFAILLFDYRGMGASDDVDSTAGAKEPLDLDAAVDSLRSQRGVQPGPVSVYGKSLGATIAILAAADNPNIGAVADESGFGRLQDVVSYNFEKETSLPAFLAPMGTWVAEKRSGADISSVDAVKAASKLSPRPLSIVHAQGDKRVRFEQSEKVFAAAGQPKELTVAKGSGHADLIESDPVVWRKGILDFLTQTSGLAR